MSDWIKCAGGWIIVICLLGILCTDSVITFAVLMFVTFLSTVVSLILIKLGRLDD